MIINTGTIESLGSDPDGDFSDPGLTNRELDAGIDFDGLDDPEANMDGTVMNMAGGVISGDIGINASSGNFVDDGEGGSEPGSAPNLGAQTIVNFGTITANAMNPVNERMDAVLLSFGNDEFQQWTGATVNGWIDLEAGDDTFILEGASSSVTGGISGGEGTDVAILAGDLDSDNFSAFETYQLGSTLGDTLNDLVISGDRTLTGDVVHVGEVTVGLGVDSLTTTGSITLEETGVLTIETPLDFDLLGDTVLVLQDGTGFTNNGATVNIIDDDLFIDYTPVIGSLSVNVSMAMPLAGSVDPNFVSFGNSIAEGITGGTIAPATLATLNALPNADALEDAARDALPSLSEGVGREIFESSNLASTVLDRHLAGESSGIWGQVAVRSAEQDALSLTADGYESDQLVFTAGADFAVVGDTRIGVLASYADIDTQDLRNGARTETNDVESIKLGLYAASSFADRGFVNAEVGYLTGEVESSRNGVLGPISSVYDFDGFTARVTAGYDLLEDEKVSFSPIVGFNGAWISFDDVTEAGGFGYTVDRADAEFAELRGGFDASAQVSDMISGFVTGVYIYDLNDDPRSFGLTSGQVGSFFANLPVREQERFEISAGATFSVSEALTVELGYLGDFNAGYDGHSGRATLRFAF
jgi:outer membrane autotransporter protein